jgi:hypothetical protein
MHYNEYENVLDIDAALWLIITKQYHWIFLRRNSQQRQPKHAQRSHYKPTDDRQEAAPIGRKNKLNKRHKAMHDTTRIQKQHKLNKDGRTGGACYRACLFTVIIHVNHSTNCMRK